MKSDVKITQIDFVHPSDFEHSLMGMHIHICEDHLLSTSTAECKLTVWSAPTVNGSLLDSLMKIDMTQFDIQAFIAFKENV